MPPSTILLVSTEPEASTTLRSILTAQGHEVTTVADADAAFQAAAKSQLVVIDDPSGPKGAVDLCREIRSTPALGRIPVLCVASGDDVEERIAFLEAGADDVLQRPFEVREVEARVESILLRFQRAAAMTPTVVTPTASTSRRQLAAVFSPKGGVGTTTIAVNMAMAVAVDDPDDVVVVDLDLRFGQVATHLDLTPSQTFSDLLADEPALNEPELLRTYTTRHDSGLHILAAPSGPGAADLVEPEHVTRILRTIRGSFPTVVVDAGTTLDERTMAALQAADVVVLPIAPEMAALKAMHALLDHLGETGALPGATSFVLNDLFARQLLRARDVDSALGTKIALQLPYDPVLYLKAVNEGVPVVIGAPKSPPAEALRKLALAVLGTGPAAATEGRVNEPASGGLLARLRGRG